MADYEVEQKFSVADLDTLQQAADKLGAVWRESARQRDLYFSHPCRDFAETDEALRLRSVGDDNVVTFKGPKLDSTTKTRREIEVAVAEGGEGAEKFTALLEALGFRRVLTVVKERRAGSIIWQGYAAEVALDLVEGLGPYVELEISAKAAEIDRARHSLGELAKYLGLADSERRSYLELLLSKKGNGE